MFRLLQRTKQTLLLALLSLTAPTLFADPEVLVFYNQYCGHCQEFMSQTGNNYATDAPQYLGNRHPVLRKFDLSMPENMTTYRTMLSKGKIKTRINAVPAFIVTNNQQTEVARSIGAMSKDEFYAFVRQSLGQQNTD